MKNIDFSLNVECAKKLPYDLFKKNFTFIVDGQEYKTSRIIADLLSPKILKNHQTDTSIKVFTINTNNL